MAGAQSRLLLAFILAVLVATASALCPDSPASSTALSDSPPTLNVTYDNADRLEFRISSVQYQNAALLYLRNVWLEIGSTPSAASYCTTGLFNGPVTEDAGTCSFEIAALSATWKEVRECGWTNAPEENGVTNVSTIVRVYWKETISTGPTAGSERTSSYEQEVSFSFPTANLAESGPIDVVADSGDDTFSVDQFTYSTETGQRVLTMVWSMTNKYPFVYDWQPNAMVFPQAGMSLLGQSAWLQEPDGCTSSATNLWSTCKQTQTFTVLLSADTCSVAGTYKFTFGTRCIENDCGSGTYTVDVTAPELPVCTSALNKVIDGVTNTLTATGGASPSTFSTGGRILFALNITSTKKLLWSYRIQDIYVVSLAAKHANDGYHNRSLYAFANNGVQTLGANLGLAADSVSFSGVHNTGGGEGRESFSDTIGFDAKIGTPETGLIASNDIGGENPFRLRVGIYLAFDTQTSLVRRRRLKYATIEAEAGLPRPKVLRRSEPANETVSERIRQGQTEYAETVFTVGGGSTSSSTIPVGAIAGIAVAGAALLAGIAAVVVMGKKRKARMEKETHAAASAEVAYKVQDVEVGEAKEGWK